MRFSWREFCDEHRIPYREDGKSVARDHINIRCPFCGINDRHGLMGLSLKTAFWGCWKNNSHRTKLSRPRPHRLIRVLLGIPMSRVEELLGEAEDAAPRESLSQLRERLRAADGAGNPVREPLRSLQWGPEFRRFADLDGVSGPEERFASYLRNRGFHDPYWVAERYDLRACLSGDHRWRIAFPFYMDGRLFGWTSRAITPGALLRYKTHPTGDTADRLVINADCASEGGRLLVLVEGPVDMLKVDAYGREDGMRAGGLLGLSLNRNRVRILARMRRRFDHFGILLDRGKKGRAMRMAEKLAFLRPFVMDLPGSAKDPGTLKPRHVLSLLDQCPAANF